MFTNFPDGYLAGDGLVVFGSPARGGQVAMGLWLETPALHNASNTERNRFQDQVRQLFRLLPKGYRLQVLWWADSEYQGALRRFAKETEDSENPTAQRLRNLSFLWHWDRMEKRQLRRERVGIFIGRAFDPDRRTPLRQGVAESFYSDQVAQARTELGELARQIAAIFGVQGGRVTAMTDPDLARVFSRKLDPSQADRPEFDPASVYDPNRSLLDNFWNSELRGQGRHGFYLDGYYHAVLVLKRWPSQTVPGLMQRLTQLPFGNYEVTVQIERLESDKLIASEQRALDRLHAQLARKTDERLSVTAASKEERIRRLSEGSILALSVEFIIVVRAKSSEELVERLHALKSAVNGLNGAQYLECSLPATARNVFAKTLPGWMWSRHKGLRLFGEDAVVADMLPLSSTFTGHLNGAEAVYCGSHSNLVGIRTFLGEGSFATPQNLIVVGGTGVGKSTLILNMLWQTEPLFDFTVVIEEGQSHVAFPRSFGIEPILIRPDGNQTLNGFDTRGLPMSAYQRGTATALVARMVGLPADEDKARQRQALIANVVAQLCHEHADDWLRRMSESDRRDLVREAFAVHRWSRDHQLSQLEAFVEFRAWQRENVNDAAAHLAEFADEPLREFEATHSQDVLDFVFSRFSNEEHLTLSSLREYLELNAEGAEADDCRWLATLLVPWCRGGNYGVLFDGPGNVSLQGRAVHFELGLIPESAKELKALAGFALMNDVRQHLLSLPKCVRKQVVVEEVARFLDVPGGERILTELFQSFRKHNAVIVAVMQQYSQIADSPIRAALVGNARAFLIFNPGDRQDVERLAHDIGLSSVAVETILRYPRPDQQTGQKYSECLYYHTDATHPICGTLRHIRLPEDGYKA